MSKTPLTNLSITLSKAQKTSEAYLRSKHNLLNSFDSVEALVIDKKLDEKDRNGILHHLLQIRSALAKQLWKAGIFIGVSVLDEFVFGAAKSGKADICGRVLDELRHAGAERPGFVLYPLTEFGMENEPFSRLPSDLKSIAVFEDAGFAVTAQANNFEDAYANLNEMAKALGISAEIEKSDLEHYARTGNMRWLTQNPLLLIRLSSHTGEYNENQFVYSLKIRIAAAQVVMLHTLGINAGIPVEKFHSTADVNNFETLDIRHYLIGEATHAEKPLDLRRVPMNVAALELARLSDLAVTLSTRTLARPEFCELEERLAPVLRSVEQGYLNHVNLRSGEKIHSRVYRRLVTAIDWYRQSFGSRTKESEAIVALAVAFETLLTDHYAPGGEARLKRRVGICLDTHPRVVEYQASVVVMYRARSEIVHNGDSGHATDILCAQAAFALCFCEVAYRLDHLDRKMVDPIRELLGDTLTPEEKDAKAKSEEQT